MVVKTSQFYFVINCYGQDTIIVISLMFCVVCSNVDDCREGHDDGGGDGPHHPGSAAVVVGLPLGLGAEALLVDVVGGDGLGGGVVARVPLVGGVGHALGLCDGGARAAELGVVEAGVVGWNKI